MQSGRYIGIASSYGRKGRGSHPRSGKKFPFRQNSPDRLGGPKSLLLDEKKRYFTKTIRPGSEV